MEADKDGDGKLNFEEFTSMVAKTVCFTLLDYCHSRLMPWIFRIL